MKIVSVIGARPEWIKAAVLSRELTDHEEVLVNTGQHYDDLMADIFLRELSIPRPKYDLEVGSGSHGIQTARVLERIEPVLVTEKPDLVIVYGDTNSTVAGALAAAKLHIPVAHVEAGLRSFDQSMPEEINRIITDHISEYLFAPTPAAMTNLDFEGLSCNAWLTGDVMADSLAAYRSQSEQSKILDTCELVPGDYRVLTVHRPANTDDKAALDSILTGVGESDLPVIFPAHPRLHLLPSQIPNVIDMIEPVGYLDMIHLMQNANKVITDSGGMQKEAYMLGVPCVTLRENTEWVETMADGWNTLVGSDTALIKSAVNRPFDTGTEHPVLYEPGACKRIVAIIEGIK